MKAIKITQEIKDKNARYKLSFVENNNVDSIVRIGFPNKFYVTEPVSGGYASRTDLHTADGWKDVIIPSYNTTTQYLGDIIESGNDFTYDVLNKSEQQIQNEAIAQSQANKEALIQQTLEQQVVEQAQSSDDTSSLDNQDLFPFWEVGFAYTIGFKCQDFNANNELKLYKCVQAHTSQSDWRPKDVPALFSVVSYPNQVDAWVQPTGAQDAYQVGDRVTHNGSTWESNTPNNVWEPGVFGWTLISTP